MCLVQWEGTVLQEMWPRLMIVILISVVLNLIQYFNGSFPVFNVIAHQLMGLALGLLLVFRTNSACTLPCLWLPAKRVRFSC